MKFAKAVMLITLASVEARSQLALHHDHRGHL